MAIILYQELTSDLNLLRERSHQLNKVWPGFNLNIEKVVSNETDVCVFVNITAEI